MIISDFCLIFWIKITFSNFNFCTCIFLKDWDEDGYLNKADLKATLLKLTKDGLDEEEVQFVIDKVSVNLNKWMIFLVSFLCIFLYGIGIWKVTTTRLFFHSVGRLRKHNDFVICIKLTTSVCEYCRNSCDKMFTYLYI